MVMIVMVVDVDYSCVVVVVVTPEEVYECDKEKNNVVVLQKIQHPESDDDDKIHISWERRNEQRVRRAMECRSEPFGCLYILFYSK